MLLKTSNSDFIKTEHIVKYEILYNNIQYTLQAILTNGSSETIAQCNSYDTLVRVIGNIEKESTGNKDMLYIEELTNKIHEDIKKNIEKHIK